MIRFLLLIMLIGLAPQINAIPFDEIHFNDAGFKDCVLKNRQSIGPEIITDEFTSIYCDGYAIQDLEGLQHFTQVTYIGLINNTKKINNLSKLATLPNLQFLILDNSKISDLSPINNLKNLITLSLSNNQINNISSLSELIGLNVLFLGHNQISDLSPLSKMINLKYLELNNNQIHDISTLFQMTKLVYLNLDHNQVSDISSFSDFVNLNELYMKHNRISTIPAEVKLFSLKTIDMAHNQLQNIAGLDNSNNLNYINLSYNKINDISSLTGKPKLTRLILSDNSIIDISPLAQSNQLIEVDLDNNQVNNISVFSEFSRVTHLYLDNNQVIDISPLSNMSELEIVNLDYNNISDLSVTFNFNKLRALRMVGNHIQDFSPLSPYVPPTSRGLKLDLREMPITCAELSRLNAGDIKHIYTDKCEGNENQFFIESPQVGGLESGIGIIRGWSCDANNIEVEIDDRTHKIDDNQRFVVAYGTSRKDTIPICGDDNNGFGIAMNWNVFGDGLHHVKILVDDQQYAKIPIYVTTLGTEFLRNAPAAQFILNDFPALGHDSNVIWSEPHQNFMLMNNDTFNQGGIQGNERAWLDTPQHGSFESGIGLIHGWACYHDRYNPIKITIDGVHHFDVAYGSTRGDVPCNFNSGFSLTVNWNFFGEGVHHLSASSGDIQFADVTFVVTTPDVETDFLQGIDKSYQLNDFPNPDSAVTISWSTDRQNFVLSKTTP